MSPYLLLSALVVCATYHLTAGTGYQKICVKGKVSCKTQPRMTSGQIVKLWDEDEGPSPDDMMASNVTDADGFFHLCGGSSDSWSDIDPIFKIYTKCNNENEKDVNCFRKMKFTIPQSYIGQTYEFADEIDIAETKAGETRRCFTGNKLNDFFKKYTGNTFQQWLKKMTGMGEGDIMNTVLEKGGEFIKETIGFEEGRNGTRPGNHTFAVV